LGLKSSPERAKQLQPRATPWVINEIVYPALKGRSKRVRLFKKCVMLGIRLKFPGFQGDTENLYLRDRGRRGQVDGFWGQLEKKVFDI
jgi:hypothetical protein